MSVKVNIEIVNQTSWNLIDPQVYIDSGDLNTPTGTIAASSSAQIVASELSTNKKGSSGVVSYLIRELNKRIVFMWGAPTNTDLRLGIASTRTGQTKPTPDWFFNLYNKKGVPEFSSIGMTDSHKSKSQSTIMDNGVKISAIVSTTNMPIIKIQITASR